MSQAPGIPVLLSTKLGQLRPLRGRQRQKATADRNTALGVVGLDPVPRAVSLIDRASYLSDRLPGGSDELHRLLPELR